MLVYELNATDIAFRPGQALVRHTLTLQASSSIESNE